MSSIGRIIDHIRWLGARETLGRTPPVTRPESPLHNILMHPDQLPQVAGEAAANRRSAARSRFWRWMATPEQLAPAPAARPPRSRFWRWMATPEQLPRTKNKSTAGTRKPRAES